MKRKIYSFLIGAMLLTLVACGKDDNSIVVSDVVTSDEQVNISETVDNNDGTSNGYVKDESLPGTLEVNLSTAKYCINIPDIYYRRANTGYIAEFNSYFIIYDDFVDISSDQQYGVNLAMIKGPQDVIENMEAQMIDTCKNGLIFADEYDVEITSEESVKVNSWDMCKTKGVINLACEWTLDYDQVDFVAYSVIKDGYPVYFAVVEDPLGEEPIDLEEMADKIAKTFRDNPNI